MVARPSFLLVVVGVPVFVPHFLRVWFSAPYLYVALPLWVWLVVGALVCWLVFRCFGGRRVSC